MFPGHRIPQSNRCYVSRPQGSRIKPQSCSQATEFHNQIDVIFPGHRFPESNRCHVPRSQASRIKPQTCPQATGFQNQTSDMFPRNKVPELNLSHVPRPQDSTTNRCHVPRPQGSTIKLMSYSQATGFQNQTDVMFPGHKSPESNLRHVPR